MEDKSRLEKKIHCQVYDSVYVGEDPRKLGVCIKEHKRDVKHARTFTERERGTIRVHVMQTYVFKCTLI